MPVSSAFGILVLLAMIPPPVTCSRHGDTGHESNVTPESSCSRAPKPTAPSPAPVPCQNSLMAAELDFCDGVRRDHRAVDAGQLCLRDPGTAGHDSSSGYLLSAWRHRPRIECDTREQLLSRAEAAGTIAGACAVPELAHGR